MLQTEVAVIGAGPAGLCAAVSARSCGARVTVIDRGEKPGGQLVKQTHKFFGSEEHYAGKRGVEIASLLSDLAASLCVPILCNATALGYYDDRVILVERDDWVFKLKAERLIVATGASERMLPFPGNDLPGVYGAGAVQTLMNVHGVRPGRCAVMVGAGNIGLIVAYQLVQAGVEVKAVVEAMPKVGGYAVHASKVMRLGVPIYLEHTIKEVHGRRGVEGVTICKVGPGLSFIPGSEKYLEADTVCLAVGLSPLSDLLWQAGCEMRYVRELGGHVPVRDPHLQTSVEGIYVAGDVAGVEEASTAILEGMIAGFAAARSLGYRVPEEERAEAVTALEALRRSPFAEKIRSGLRKVVTLPLPGTGAPSPACGATSGLDGSSFSGGTVITHPNGGVTDAKTGPSLPRGAPITGPDGLSVWIRPPYDLGCLPALPDPRRRKAGPYAVFECRERIPCDPCTSACKAGAVTGIEDINDVPSVDYEKCTGCGVCVSECPGLAVFVVDETYSEREAVVRIPYELLPLPEPGEEVTGLDRDGRGVCPAKVIRVEKRKNRTHVVWLVVPKEFAMTVRHFAPNRFPPQEKGGPGGSAPAASGNTVVCRCEDVTLAEIHRLIDEGFRTADEIKRVSRCGMGTCQGKTCMNVLLEELAKVTGVPVQEQRVPTFRPPAKPVKLGALTRAAEDLFDDPGGGLVHEKNG